MTKKPYALILAFAFAATAISQVPETAPTMRSLEFKNQEIRDILFVLASLNDVSIVPDNTVQGKASFFFSSMAFDEALRIFLASNGLNYVKKDSIYYVSRIFTQRDPTTSLLTIKCFDVPLRDVISAISSAAGKTILFDQLPSDTITLQVENASLQDIVGIIVAKYHDLTIENKGNYIYIRRKDQAGQSPESSGDGFFKVSGDLYSVSANRARFRDLTFNLFSNAGKEVVFLMDQDVVLENLDYKEKTFDQMLKLLLVKVGGDFSISEGVYYIMEVQKRDLQSKFLTTLLVPLKNISMQDFQRLLPPSLGSGGKMKTDEKDNKLVLNGTLEEIRPILDFVALVDAPTTNGSTVRIDLSYLRSDEAIPLLPSEYASFGPVPLPSRTGFMITLPPAKAEKLRDLIAIIDRIDPAVPITLDYIKADELLSSLPPSVTDQNVKKTTDPRMIYFKGTEAQRKAFIRDLAAIDHPRPQIKYQVFVLALSDTDSDDWQSGLSVAKTDKGSDFSLTKGDFKDLLGIGFDVIASFGLDFVLSLQWKIERNKAQVLADTTLTSLSGERISFKNTQTSRFKDTEVTSSTSTTTTQIIREISSGFLLNIEGWVSGGRMITMKIDTTLSETLQSDSASGLPQTAEKVMSSTARTEIGKPIVVTGLRQSQVTKNTKKVPILGDIPLLGLLFRTKSDKVVNTDYVISIVPRLELPELARDQLEREIVEGYYRYLFAEGAPRRN
jgi:general secretion pathway protein D